MAGESISKIKKFQDEAKALLQEQGLEKEHQEATPLWRKFVHFWIMVGKSFVRNRCPVRASALAYTTLLALIPMLAVVLSVTTSVLKSQGEKPIRDFVNMLVNQVTPEVRAEDVDDPALVEMAAKAAATREEAVKKINEFITRTQSGAIGITGTIALVFVAISMLARIENTFNDIWGVMRGRSWYMRVVLYWAAITLGPVAIVGAVGLTGGAYFAQTSNWIGNVPFVGGLITKFLPGLVLGLLFTMLYQLMPNTKVRFSAALVGGLMAGFLWQVNNVLSAKFVSRITSNNAIYGSLGTVPVFMIGLYFGWMILLFGAQVAYAWQNRQAYVQEKLSQTVNQRGREFVALRIMTRLAEHFHRGEKPPGLTQLARSLGLPTNLAGQVLQFLMQAKLIAETVDREPGYLPARPLDQITAHDVMLAMRTGQGSELATTDDASRSVVRSEFERFGQAEREAAGSVSLQKLVSEIPAPQKTE